MLSCLVVCLSVCLSDLRVASSSWCPSPSLPPSLVVVVVERPLYVGLSVCLVSSSCVCLCVVVARSAPSGPAAVLVGYVVVVVILAEAGQCRTSAPAPRLLLLAPCLPACQLLAWSCTQTPLPVLYSLNPTLSFAQRTPQALP